jgi:transposase-like protein
MPQLVVTAVLVEGRSKSEVARDYGVSRRWVITLVQRFLADGDAGLVPRSRRPQHSPGRTPQQVEDEIIALRKDLDRSGHEAGAATIAAHLQQTSPACPGGVDDLADPVRPRIRHPTTAQTTQIQLTSPSVLGPHLRPQRDRSDQEAPSGHSPVAPEEDVA